MLTSPSVVTSSAMTDEYFSDPGGCPHNFVLKSRANDGSVDVECQECDSIIGNDDAPFATDFDEKEERKRFFLEGLAWLTEKSGVEIGGCGECGSPWLNDVVTDETLATFVIRDRETNKYNPEP